MKLHIKLLPKMKLQTHSRLEPSLSLGKHRVMSLDKCGRT